MTRAGRGDGHPRLGSEEVPLFAVIFKSSISEHDRGCRREWGRRSGHRRRHGHGHGHGLKRRREAVGMGAHGRSARAGHGRRHGCGCGCGHVSGRAWVWACACVWEDMETKMTSKVGRREEKCEEKNRRT